MHVVMATSLAILGETWMNLKDNSSGLALLEAHAF